MALAAIVGAWTESQREQSSLVFSREWPKLDLTFDLGGFKAYTFTLGDKKMTVAPEEMMEALTHTHTPQTFESGVQFLVGGRTVLFCKDCGQTYWEGT
jgi:hypothetical protein